MFKAAYHLKGLQAVVCSKMRGFQCVVKKTKNKKKDFSAQVSVAVNFFHHHAADSLAHFNIFQVIG